jgi:hypothetical protein
MTQNQVEARQEKKIMIFENGVAVGSVTQVTHAVSAVGLLFVHGAHTSLTFPIFS